MASDYGLWMYDVLKDEWAQAFRGNHTAHMKANVVSVVVNKKDPRLVTAALQYQGILRSEDAGQTWSKVYENNTPGIFFDDFDFDGKKGFAIGDPMPNGNSYDHAFIITIDSGKTWLPLRNHVFRNNAKDAGLFAASASNILIDGESLNAICGGDSAMFLSSKLGKIKLPVKSGGAFGPYSMDRYGKCYAVVGGHYGKKEWSDSIACYSKDRGKTWKLFETMPNGYKSSVKFFKTHKQLIAVGTTGVDVSSDFGKTWKRISETSFNTVEVYGSSIWLVGNYGLKMRLEAKNLKKLEIPAPFKRLINPEF